ncbi:AraC family transcriptional regulator [Streptomyces sp. NPDC091281]|uniref:AraC family transcriptional regulator n=1 Tax=Streptomyces sp. NPDC091281 TaxID=3365985 RepID=UPI0038123A99
MSQNSHSPAGPPRITRHDHVGGETIERHRHAFHQLIHVDTGVLSVRTEEASWVASSARAMWIPADTWHEHRVYGASHVRTVGFPADDPPLCSPTPTVVSVDPLLRELLLACGDPGLTAAEAQRLQAVLRDRIRRCAVQPLTLPAPRDARLARACALAAADLARPRTVAWLARRAGVSERTLARLFRSEFGMTYPQWRTLTRVFHAMIRLAEGATVTAAGRDCGWATTSAFIDVFTRTVGQTPGAHRAAARGDRAPAP